MRNHKSIVRFAICIDNEGYRASLDKGKAYEVIDDPEAAAHHLIRIVDESGEDYAYPTKRFFPIEVPEAVRKALKRRTSRQTNTAERSVATRQSR
jgi:hypothetical protein